MARRLHRQGPAGGGLHPRHAGRAVEPALRLGRRADPGTISMMEVRLASIAAPGRPNEDYALAVGDLVAVFDGVTQPDGVVNGCVHGPAWYVRRLVAHLYA